MPRKYVTLEDLEYYHRKIQQTYATDGDLDALSERHDSDLDRLRDELDESIREQITSAYKVQGSTSFSELPDPSADNLGDVFSVTDDFTTDERFKNPGQAFPPGTNVVVVQDGDTYKYDVFSNDVDLSNYVQKNEKVAQAVHADAADVADIADEAERLGSITVGSRYVPIYLNEGVPNVIDKILLSEKAESADRLGTQTVGGPTKPVYLEDGTPKETEVSASENRFGVLPVVTDDGTTDIGISIKFHNWDDDDRDYAVKIESGSPDTPVDLTLPSKSGQIALVEDIPEGGGSGGDSETAKVAERLGTETVGSETEPIYLLDGFPVAIPKVGLATKADSSDTSEVSAKLGEETVGSPTHGIYLDNGVPKVVEAQATIETAEHSTSSDLLDSMLLVTEDLDDLTEDGKVYYAEESNSVVNKPEGIDAFGMLVSRSNKTGYYQLLYPSDQFDNSIWYRQLAKSGWSEWDKIYPVTSITEEDIDEMFVRAGI